MDLDAAFESLRLSISRDESAKTTFEMAEAVASYEESLALFTPILQSTFNVQSRKLIMENIALYQKRVESLKAQISDLCKKSSMDNNVPTARAVLAVDEDALNLDSLPVAQTSRTLTAKRFEVASAPLFVAGSTLLDEALTMDENNNVSVEETTKRYLSAAEKFLELLKLDQESDNLSLRRRIDDILARVEELKSPQSTVKNEPPPPPKVNSSLLTKTEISVLKESSIIGKKVFMPFLHSEIQSFNFNTLGNTLFEDPDGLINLGPSQSQNFFKWARPSEIAQHRGQHLAMIHNINPFSIKQLCVGDCSFVASLCISAAHEKLARRRLVTSIIYPQNNRGQPFVNECGKYVVKLWYNGVERRIVIDDRLPVDRNYETLCSHTTNKSYFELWVPLIEKAYMKLMSGKNGYGFIGSNSGVDLYSLTGWLPERVFFSSEDGLGKKKKDHETDSERVWERILSSHRFGDALMTAAVSESISEAQADLVGLFTGHAYAILNVKEVLGGMRFVLMKNPWASKPWIGKYSHRDVASWTSQLQSALGYNIELARTSDDGLFWIGWSDFLKYFRCLHLNWNPSLFKYKFTTHVKWPVTQGPASDQYYVSDNPQFSLHFGGAACKNRSSVWILLNRHTSKEELEGYKDGEEVSLTCHVHRIEKNRRVIYPHIERLVQGIYSNNCHNLIRYDLTGEKDSNLVLVLSQFKKFEDVRFSISVFCGHEFAFSPTPQFFSNKFRLEGRFDDSNSGGAIGRSSPFFCNPQYALECKRDVKLQVLMKANPQRGIFFAVAPRPGSGGRLENLQNEAFGSGMYSQAVAFGEGKLQQGQSYVLLLSCLNEGDIVKYVLDLFCDGAFGSDLIVKKIKEEGADMEKHAVNNIVGSSGCSNFGNYAGNAQITIRSNSDENTCFVRLKCNKREAINLSVFRGGSEGFIESSCSPISKVPGQVKTTTNSGVYTTSETVVTASFKLAKNERCILVPSSFEPAPTLMFSLVVYSKDKLGLKRIK